MQYYAAVLKGSRMFTRQNAKGFTLIELLVVIAIVTLLLGILLPSLKMAKEIARRVVCSTQLKGFGTALYLYSQDYEEKAIPNSSSNGKEYFGGIDPGKYQPWWSYVIGDDTGASDPELLNAFNHGKLYGLQYLEQPDLYYCPSAVLTLKSVGPKYTHNYYFEDAVRSMPPHKSSGWGGQPDGKGNIRCRSSYSYWTWGKTSFLELTNKPVVVDSLVRIPHLKRGKPFAVNALFGDGHASTTLVSNTPEILDYINQETWDERAKDYKGFVGVLKMLKP